MKLDDVVVAVMDRLYQSAAFELELIIWRNGVIMYVFKIHKEGVNPSPPPIRAEGRAHSYCSHYTMFQSVNQ